MPMPSLSATTPGAGTRRERVHAGSGYTPGRHTCVLTRDRGGGAPRSKGQSGQLPIEVRVEDGDLGDLFDRELTTLGGLADRIGIRCVVDAERLSLVLAYVRVHPSYAQFG